MPVNNAVPFEVMAGPTGTLYLAPVGTTFPTLIAAPAVDWIKIGTSGPLNYGEEGIKVSHSQEVNEFYGLGDTGTRKVFRTRESLKIGVMLYDLTLQQYKFALNGNTVSDVPGNPDASKIGLSRGLVVTTYALLLRLPSPKMANGVSQYQIPIVQSIGNPEPTFVKGEPAGLALEFAALVDPDAASDDERFGIYLVQEDDES